MLQLAPIIGPDAYDAVDDLAWAASNDHWDRQSVTASIKRPTHGRSSRPLVLCGHGVLLKVDQGSLLIRNGFTHFPQERQTYRYFKGDLNLPPRIIMVDGSGSLSFDVLTWLSEQDVPLVRIGFQGDVVTVVSGSGSAFDPHRVAWQDQTRSDAARRLEFCCDLIALKIRNTIGTLETVIPRSSARDMAIRKADAAIARLQGRGVRSVNDVLMVEAGAAARYFNAWRGLPIDWKYRARQPVPDSWFAAGSRRTVRDSRFSTNRNATHPINAMLNYGYAVLHSQVQAEAVGDGLDPRRGIMHESRPDAQAMVLDLMEPGRPRVDEAVLRFVSSNAFVASDFALRSDGVVRLAPQLARRLCSVIANERGESLLHFADGIGARLSDVQPR